MTTTTAYSYVLLRYIHDSFREESVNVGVLAYAKNDRAVEFVARRNLAELRHVFPDFSPSRINEYLKSIKRCVQDKQNAIKSVGLFSEDLPENAKEIAYSILAYDESAMRWSEMGAGVSTNDLKTIALELCQSFVAGPQTSQKRTQKTDSAVWRIFSEALETAAAPIDDFVARNIDTGTIVEKYDHTYQNGKLHCLKPVSLDLASAENIANKVVSEYGRFKAVEQAKGSDYALYLLVGESDNPDLKNEAQKLLRMFERDNGVSVFNENQAAEFAEKFVLNISHHSP